MSYKKVMMDVIRGNAADFLPFAPRLDIWYRSNKLRGTLPPKYKNASLSDIIDDLDVGYNTMIPDFLECDSEDDYIHRGIGLLTSATSNTHKVVFHNVEVAAEQTAKGLLVTYTTPFGKVSNITRLDDEMKAQGITAAAVVAHTIDSVDDYKAVQYIFENAQVVPDYERFNRFQSKVGDRGIAVCLGNLRESGVRFMNMELMKYEQAVFDMFDHPQEFASLRATLDTFLDNLYDVAINSPADVINVGAHFDATLTPPPFFKKYVLPRLKTYSDAIHSKGKFMASHTDSENRGLLQSYIDSGMDIADSVCTKPLTSQNYNDIRSVTGNNLTLYGVVPSIAMLENSVSDYEFDGFIDDLLADIQDDGARNIILSIADTTPPDAKFERVQRIAALSRQVKPK
ncbi:MAG: hypothetical protein HN948_03195 [Clostridia bacterium]|jgi:hypothetical protein|nr:hypothetical protein [Clostridia bacterium]MBT7121999.1 hypothetical protein [Clostridia bacterium]